MLYHNWRHALNVTQSMFVMLTTCKLNSMMSSLEQLALLIACMCHDLDHRGRFDVCISVYNVLTFFEIDTGTNNSFQTK